MTTPELEIDQAEDGFNARAARVMEAFEKHQVAMPVDPDLAETTGAFEEEAISFEDAMTSIQDEEGKGDE